MKYLRRKRGVAIVKETNSNSPTINGKQYHIQLSEGDIPPYILISGAPERLDIISSFWESAEQIAQYREFRTIRGKYSGSDIAGISSGIGTTSSEICIHELNNIGVHTACLLYTSRCV